MVGGAQGDRSGSVALATEMSCEDLGEPPVVLRVEPREEADVALDEVVLPAAERSVSHGEYVTGGSLACHVSHPSTPVGPPCGWPHRSTPDLRRGSARSRRRHPFRLHDRPAPGYTIVPRSSMTSLLVEAHCQANSASGRRSLRVTHPSCTLEVRDRRSSPRRLGHILHPSEGDAHEPPFNSSPVRQEPRQLAYVVGRGISCTSEHHG